MKKVTVRYISGLGDYLDENNIQWFNNGDDTITFEYKTEGELFYIGWSFGMFYEKLQQQLP